MPLTKNPTYIKEPTDLQCGQAVLAMLTDNTVETIVNLLQNKKETTLKEMLYTLDYYGILYKKEKKQANKISDLSNVALLSLETPRCWHWSLYFNGLFYDPEHGVLKDFPICKRKFFWEILE